MSTNKVSFYYTIFSYLDDSLEPLAGKFGFVLEGPFETAYEDRFITAHELREEIHQMSILKYIYHTPELFSKFWSLITLTGGLNWCGEWYTLKQLGYLPGDDVRWMAERFKAAKEKLVVYV